MLHFCQRGSSSTLECWLVKHALTTILICIHVCVHVCISMYVWTGVCVSVRTCVGIASKHTSQTSTSWHRRNLNLFRNKNNKNTALFCVVCALSTCKSRADFLLFLFQIVLTKYRRHSLCADAVGTHEFAIIFLCVFSVCFLFWLFSLFACLVCEAKCRVMPAKYYGASLDFCALLWVLLCFVYVCDAVCMVFLPLYQLLSTEMFFYVWNNHLCIYYNF